MLRRMCKRVEEGDKISFRISEVPRMSHKEQWFKETRVLRNIVDYVQILGCFHK